jgi:hypothetical protein
VKIKFSLNENIEWHCMQLEFNSKKLIEFKYIKCNLNLAKFNQTIGLNSIEKNGTKIGG